MKQLTAKEMGEFVRGAIRKLTADELLHLLGAFLYWIDDVGIDQAFPLNHFLLDVGMTEQDVADYNEGTL